MRRLWDRANDVGVTYVLPGALVGIAAGVWAIEVHKVLDDERTILITMGGADAALLAVVIAVVGLMVGLLEGLFGRLIENTEGGLRGFFFPFVVMAYAAALATATCFGAAIAVDSSGDEVNAALFGASVGLSVWTAFGCVALTSVIIKYAGKKRVRDTKRETRERKERERALPGKREATPIVVEGATVVVQGVMGESPPPRSASGGGEAGEIESGE